MKTIILLIAFGILASCSGHESIETELNIQETIAFEAINASEENFEENSVISETIELSGYVFEYDNSSKSACFFVDSEMVAVGVATDISNQVSEDCHHFKFGKGAKINFSKVPSNESYTTPVNGVLIAVTGYWTKNTKEVVFHVKSFEPFF